jgi:methionyl-tRNA formyltransferase
LALEADAAVVVAYGLLLPAAILEAPRLGCYNVHASLLPRWRGAAPIQRAVMAGDEITGVSIMRMTQGLDEGPVCLAEAMPIVPGTTAGELHDQLAALGANLMSRALANLAAGELDCTPQPPRASPMPARSTRAKPASISRWQPRLSSTTSTASRPIPAPGSRCPRAPASRC